jgi:hypothetical protein
MATTETRPVADIADIEEKDDAKSTLTAASKHEGGLSVDPEEERDMGLQLTCSFRSGVGPRELALEHPPDGGLRAWLQGMLFVAMFVIDLLLLRFTSGWNPHDHLFDLGIHQRMYAAIFPLT